MPFALFLSMNYSAESTKSNNGGTFRHIKTTPQQLGNTCDQHVLTRYVTCDGESVSLVVNSFSLSL